MSPGFKRLLSDILSRFDDKWWQPTKSAWEMRYGRPVVRSREGENCRQPAFGVVKCILRTNSVEFPITDIVFGRGNAAITTKAIKQGSSFAEFGRGVSGNGSDRFGYIIVNTHRKALRF